MRWARLGIAVPLALVVALATPVPAGTASGLMTDSEPLVVAYDARSGERQWRMTTSGPGHAQVLAATTTRVLVEVGRCLSLDREEPDDRELVVLDAGTGEVEWRRPSVSSRGFVPSDEYWFPSGVASSARVVPVLDLAGDSIRAFDVRTGRVRWRMPADGLRPAATDRDVVLLASNAGWNDALPDAAGAPRVRALDARTGRTIWERDLASGAQPAGVLLGPTVVAAVSFDPGGSLETFDLKTGELIARSSFEAPGVNVYDFAVTRDVVAVGGFSGGLPMRTVGLDVTTGATLWVADGRFVTVDPSEPDALYGSRFGSQNDPQARAANEPRVARLDTNTGEPRWDVASPGWAIGQAHGTLVVARGEVYDGDGISTIDTLGGLDRDGTVRWDKGQGRGRARTLSACFPRPSPCRRSPPAAARTSPADARSLR